MKVKKKAVTFLKYVIIVISMMTDPSYAKALFLDRDGVINMDKQYVHDRDEYVFIPEIFPLLRLAQDKGYKLIITTNQSGIGRDYYTEHDFHELMKWVLDELKKEHITIADVFYCPFHPEALIDHYMHADHPDRKPNPGMLLKGGQKHHIDMAHSLMIGDHWKDMQAAHRAGVGKGLLFTTNQKIRENPPKDLDGFEYEIIGNLEEVAEFLR